MELDVSKNWKRRMRYMSMLLQMPDLDFNLVDMSIGDLRFELSGFILPTGEVINRKDATHIAYQVMMGHRALNGGGQ